MLKFQRSQMAQDGICEWFVDLHRPTSPFTMVISGPVHNETQLPIIAGKFAPALATNYEQLQHVREEVVPVNV